MHHFIHFSGFGHQDGGLFLLVLIVLAVALVSRRS
jgi:hypothetical protein